jgi:hypothetical protein
MVNHSSNINTMNDHLSSQIIEHEMFTTYDVGNQILVLRQVQACGEVKLVN